MGAGNNPNPGAGLELPNHGRVRRVDPLPRPGGLPQPQLPMFVHDELRYLSFQSFLSAANFLDVVIEPAIGTSAEVSWSDERYPAQLHLELRDTNDLVAVTTINSVATPASPAKFVITARGVGNPGEPAVVLRFESRERMPAVGAGPNAAPAEPVLVWEIAVWIEPTRGTWISGLGNPNYDLKTVPAHAVMFPGPNGSEFLFWGPARKRIGQNEDQGYVESVNNVNGGFVWDFGSIHYMEVRYWIPPTGREPAQLIIPDPPLGVGGEHGDARNFNLFCAGQVLLANGTAVIAGGHVAGSIGPIGVGVQNSAENVVTFDPRAIFQLMRFRPRPWHFAEGLMGGKRWYPTQTTLPSGRVLIMSGLHDSFGYFPPEYEWIPKTFARGYEGSSAEHGPGLEGKYLLPEVVQDKSTETTFDIYDPVTDALVRAPQPRPELLWAKDAAAYPGVYVLPRVGAGVLMVQERNNSFLFNYSEFAGKDFFWPQPQGTPPDLSVRPDENPGPARGHQQALGAPAIPDPLELVGPPFYPLKSPGSRSWPWYAVSVLLPLDAKQIFSAKILVAGGSLVKTNHRRASTIDATTAAAEIFDFDGRQPIEHQVGRDGQLGWRSIAPMRFKRILSDATLLADGNVFVTGGASTGHTDDNSGWVLQSELFDPINETWRLMEPSPTDRRYHSLALLREDGTVIKAGSHGGLIEHRDNIRPRFHVDVYQPPYLFRSPRPRIVDVSQPRDGTTRTLSQDPLQPNWIDVATDDDNTDFRIALVRFGGITHGNYMDQRFIWLEIDSISATVPRAPFVIRDDVPARPRMQMPIGTVGTGIPEQPVFEPTMRPGEKLWRITFKVPPIPSLVPPGNYMLFVLNQYGVPSIAEFTILVLELHG